MRCSLMDIILVVHSIHNDRLQDKSSPPFRNEKLSIFLYDASAPASGTISQLLSRGYVT